MKHWLFKSEPSTYAIDDLRSAPGGTDHWDGIRNYQARNFLRDEVQAGDRVLFYHSSTTPTAVVGTARVARGGYPDHTAWDPDGDHFDPRSTADKPVWYMVDLTFEEKFPVPVTMEALRAEPALKEMMLLRKGMRLSVQPVTAAEFEAVLKLARRLAQAE